MLSLVSFEANKAQSFSRMAAFEKATVLTGRPRMHPECGDGLG